MRGFEPTEAKFVSAFIFILVLILSREMISSEGRNLKSETRELHDTKYLTNVQSIGKSTMSSDDMTTSKIEADEFRTTAPGHSPGMGHSP
ncbi:hypothetical protein ACLOJK_013645 [Asimina triloba]